MGAVDQRDVGSVTRCYKYYRGPIEESHVHSWTLVITLSSPTLLLLLKEQPSSYPQLLSGGTWKCLSVCGSKQSML
jgi:hypothetical protein